MKKGLLTCFIILSFAVTSSLRGQQQDSVSMSGEYFRMGMEVYDFTHRKQSTELFVMATRFDPKNAKAQFMAGMSIMLTINKEESLPYFQKAYKLNPEVDDDILFYLGRGYQYSEKFDSAILMYDKFNNKLAMTLDFNKSRRITDINRKIFECRNARIFKANPVNVKITNLSEKINSEWPDYAPNITADESFMVFTSRRPEGNINPSVAADHEYYEDIYYSRRVNGEWQEAKNIGPPLNSQFHNASVNISPDGKEVFIYSDAHGGDLFASFINSSGAWSAPKSLDEINTADIENSVTITKDGQRLYFTSNRPGTYGGTDIFTCVKGKNGAWTDIKNIGPIVNSEYDEEDVFITANGKHLYFSSNGHAGMGDLDIYRSIYDSATGQWGVPQNLGYPINSVENDIYFVLSGDEKHAYYSSVKKDNKGEQDIYEMDMNEWKPIEVINSGEPGSAQQTPQAASSPKVPTPTPAAVSSPKIPTPDAVVTSQKVILDIVVIDEETKKTMPATVSLHTSTNKVPSTETASGQYHFEWSIKPGTQSKYDLSVNQNGYNAWSSPLHLFIVDASNGSVAIRDTVRLKKAYVTTGPPTIVPVQFGNNGDQPLSFDGIMKIEKMMKENVSMKVEIAGYTDDRGEADYNLALSRRRAESVRAYLIKSGIQPERVVAAGFGEDKPIAGNHTEDGKRLNRRTEFTLIEN